MTKIVTPPKPLTQDQIDIVEMVVPVVGPPLKREDVSAMTGHDHTVLCILRN